MPLSVRFAKRTESLLEQPALILETSKAHSNREDDLHSSPQKCDFIPLTLWSTMLGEKSWIKSCG